MKKIFKQSIISLVVVMSMLVMVGCSSKNDASEDDTAQGANKEIDEISIVTTIFPIYDWVSQITSDAKNINVTLLADTGADLHNFQPTADDIITISESDMFIYVGGESDAWVDKVLESDVVANSQNDDRVVLNLIDILGDNAKEEEIVEGMEQLDDEHIDDEEHSEVTEIDEHVWLSLKNTQIFCDELLKELVALDNENADMYTSNYKAYMNHIDILDEMYDHVAKTSELDTIVVCDRFPFRYLVDDYGLNYYAMLSGCSAETDVSFETVAFLSNKIKELGIDTVITTENPKPLMAEAVLNNIEAETKISVLQLDSMQSITANDLNDNLSYLEIMERNLNVLKIALHYE